MKHMTGAELRDEGALRAEQAVAQNWKSSAYDAIKRLASQKIEFTAEDVRDLAGSPPEGHHNAMGALFLRASKSGLIQRIGEKSARRPSRHANRNVIWAGL